MTDSKDQFCIFKKTYLKFAGVLLLILIAFFLVWFNQANSLQAEDALIAQIYFDGEYRIADGEWKPIVKGQHIPSTQGDVTLRGQFHILLPDGEYLGVFNEHEPISFYMDHINLTFYEPGLEPYVIDCENSIYGDSVCGKIWDAHSFAFENSDQIEIVVHNPHNFGNETAIDEMLDNVAFWIEMDFEKEILNSGKVQRNAGVLLTLVSFVFLGTALFSSLIHIKNNKIIWLLGLLILFAGMYYAYSADGVSVWSESIIANTTILGISMMFYMLFVSMIIVYFLKTTKKVGDFTMALLGAANAVFFVLPILTDIYFYDVWVWWLAAQTAANMMLAACLIREFRLLKTKIRWGYIATIIPLLAFEVDIFGTWKGIWKGGLCSQYIFAILFAIALVMLIAFIPRNINAAAKAKELEMEKVVLHAELAESRISTMMSQIRPHFIYNTLGSIEQLCELDPPKAGELVHNFAKYLRGNFGELDNPKPILMSQEMAHVHHYVSIENVRFPDMTFSFEMNSDDFHIPALTIQPIVENAIKHGLMQLHQGGSIRVVSYETEMHYCVSVEDDGGGFDTSLLIDERKHVGLRNIRERLKAMVNGSLEIESEIGVGTKVLIKIPKEEKR